MARLAKAMHSFSWKDKRRQLCELPYDNVAHWFNWNVGRRPGRMIVINNKCHFCVRFACDATLYKYSLKCYVNLSCVLIFFFIANSRQRYEHLIESRWESIFNFALCLRFSYFLFYECVEHFSTLILFLCHQMLLK